MAGLVLTRADLELPIRSYDYLVVGGGILGAWCAFLLAQLRPEAKTLLVERGGIPSEEGATQESPGLMGLVPGDALTSWVRSNLLHGPSRPWAVPGFPRPARPGALSFFSVSPTRWPRPVVPTTKFFETLPRAAASAAAELIDGDVAPLASFDPEVGYLPVAAAATALARAALAAGADLLLNTDVRALAADTVELVRLSYDRTLRPRPARRETIAVATVVVAAGAWGGKLIESGLGVDVRLPRSYQQYPRIEGDARLPLRNGVVALPILSCLGVSLRPQGAGMMVVPPSLPPDPEGYRPQQGRLLGVPVGVRRELLDAFLDREAALKFLSWPTFNLGKTVAQVRGAWQVVGPHGEPTAARIGRHRWWLVAGGGPGIDADLGAGAAVAFEAAGLPPPGE